MIAIGLVGLQITIMTLVLGFTSRNSTVRPAALILIVYAMYLQFSYDQDLQHTLYRAFVGAASVYLVFLYIDTVLLHRWTFTAKGPTSSMGGLTPVECQAPIQGKRPGTGVIWEALARLRFGLSISLQSRFPATKWPVKNIPPFRKKDPQYVPGKVEFLRGMIIKWSLYALILDLGGLFNNGSDNTVTFSKKRVPFFSRLASVSSEELCTRIISIIAYWSIQYLVLEVVYATLAIGAVALDVTTVNEWPPMFGSGRDSYSLRQFWG